MATRSACAWTRETASRPWASGRCRSSRTQSGVSVASTSAASVMDRTHRSRIFTAPSATSSSTSIASPGSSSTRRTDGSQCAQAASTPTPVSGTNSAAPVPEITTVPSSPSHTCRLPSEIAGGKIRCEGRATIRSSSVAHHGGHGVRPWASAPCRAGGPHRMDGIPAEVGEAGGHPSVPRAERAAGDSAMRSSRAADRSRKSRVGCLVSWAGYPARGGVVPVSAVTDVVIVRPSQDSGCPGRDYPRPACPCRDDS